MGVSQGHYGLPTYWAEKRPERPAMVRELTSPYRFGGRALAASGILFIVLAFLDFRAGPPPSNGAEILLWRDAQALVLDFVSELLFFATVLLVPGTVALYESLVDIDRTRAATGCGIIATAIPVMAVMLIIHGRLVYPVAGMRVDTPETAAFVIMVFYGGLHAIYLLVAVATVVLSLAMKRGAYPKWIIYSGFVTAALDIIGSYPWVIGPVITLVCEMSFGGWFVAVGSRLGRMRGATPDFESWRAGNVSGT